MAIRMQQRRGTAEQWTIANPVLAAGEIGFETDRGKFKIGDGVNNWGLLDYFLGEDTLTSSLEDYVPSSALGVSVATLDVNGQVPSEQLPDIGELSQDAVNQALTAGTGITKAYDDVANTLTLAVDTDTIATKTYVGNEIAAIPPVDISGKQDKVAGVSDTEIGYLDGVTSAIQTQLDGKANLSGATFTGNVTVETDLIIDGNLTVSGTTTTVSAQDLIVSDPLIYMGEGNNANLVDLGIVASYDDGTYQHTGIVRDSSANKWKLFKGVTDEPTTVVNFAQGSLDDLAVAGLEATSATIGDVSNTELQYLNGVTSAIQTQIDGKAATSHTHLLANITDVTASAAELNVLDGVTASTTELNYVDGVTSAIQTQLDGKAALSHSHNGSAITYTIEDKTANYTIVAADEGKVIRSTGSAITVTVADVFAIGEVVTFTQYGAGQITFAPAGGVTLHSVDTKRKTNKQYSTVQIMKTAAATYLLFGDIAA